MNYKKLPAIAILSGIGASVLGLVGVAVASSNPPKDTVVEPAARSFAWSTPSMRTDVNSKWWSRKPKPSPTHTPTSVPTPVPTTTTPTPTPTTPTPTPTVTTPVPSPTVTQTTPPPVGQSLVFSAPFTDTTNWVLGKTSSYPGSPPQTNPGDNKLDHLRYAPGVAPAKRFSATKINGVWWTDLVTTEGTAKNFKVKTGDELDVTVTLYSAAQTGAWPAIWTWGSGSQGGHGEVDLFEYHPDNPRLLELSNHVTGSGNYLDNKFTPGVPFDLKVKFLASGVQWYVNGALVYTGSGLPSTWSASLIVNISVVAGQYHPAPPASETSLYFDVENLRVYR